MDVMRWLMVVGLTVASLFFVVAVGIAGWLYFAKRAAKRLGQVSPDTEQKTNSLLEEFKSAEG